MAVAGQANGSKSAALRAQDLDCLLPACRAVMREAMQGRVLGFRSLKQKCPAIAGHLQFTTFNRLFAQTAEVALFEGIRHFKRCGDA